MRHQSPARFLAPLALLAAIGAVYLLVHNADLGGGSKTATTSSQPATKKGGNGQGKSSKAADRKAAKGPKSYTVKPGDTLTQIASRTGVSTDQITELNPNLDPQGLQPGQKIKLRP
ncbi:MAG TPA: LysM domain-containing protein [Solirubrobacteraceae bacterium]|jgi:LysM repeat protein